MTIWNSVGLKSMLYMQINRYRDYRDIYQYFITTLINGSDPVMIKWELGYKQSSG
jgi:hypothetical protein